MEYADHEHDDVDDDEEDDTHFSAAQLMGNEYGAGECFGTFHIPIHSSQFKPFFTLSIQYYFQVMPMNWSLRTIEHNRAGIPVFKQCHGGSMVGVGKIAVKVCVLSEWMGVWSTGQPFCSQCE